MLIDHYVPRYDFTEVQELPLDPLEVLQLAGNDAV